MYGPQDHHTSTHQTYISRVILNTLTYATVVSDIADLQKRV